MRSYAETESEFSISHLLSIVVPVFNSEKTLLLLVEEIERALCRLNFEIIFVNDSSMDNSYSVLKTLALLRPYIMVVDLSRNFGQHNALMAGIKFAKGDIIILMDDDLQHPPSEILKLLHKMEENDYDVVYGNYTEKKHNAFRNLGSRINDWLATVFMGKPEDLYFCSFKAIRSFVAGEILKYTGAYPYIDGLIFRITTNIGSVKTEHREREIGASNYTFRKLVRLWLNMFTNFSIRPLRMVMGLGFFMSITAFFLTLYIFLNRSYFSAIQQGWASIMVSVMLFAGIQLVCIGFLGEYLGRTYLTVNQSPQYVIRRIIPPNPEGK